jgi:hypothetical protein
LSLRACARRFKNIGGVSIKKAALAALVFEDRNDPSSSPERADAES